MVKSRIKTKIMAAATSLIMSFSIAFGGYDMSNVSANEGPEYTKYTFATGQTETYHLGEVPVSYNIPQVSTASLIEDNRENTEDISVVRITIYRYIDPSNPNAGYYTSSGTGTIIGDHEILTAAHLFYESDEFRPKADVTLPSSDTVPTLEATSVHIPSAYMDDDLAQNDYAILTVPYYLTAYSGYYTLGIGTEQIGTKNPPIHSLGYKGGDLKLSHGEIKGSSLSFYRLDIDSDHGSSGGPIYTETVVNTAGEIKRHKTVISLVSWGELDNNNNHITYGVKITPEILRFAYDNEHL